MNQSFLTIILLVVFMSLLIGCGQNIVPMDESQYVEPGPFNQNAWDEAVQIINSGEVDSIFLGAGNTMSLVLKNGSWVKDIQMPPKTSTRDILDDCGAKCEDIVIALP